MHRRDFHFDLPADLIAQYPPAGRGDSRLLCLDRGTGNYSDHHFSGLPAFLRAGDLLVFNDTRVIPARLFGRKATGGRVEILVERLLSGQRLLCQLRASKTPPPGSLIVLEDNSELQVIDRQEEFFRLRLVSEGTPLEKLQSLGHLPLPPYIQRVDEALDAERYQTVYARQDGAVAAPTAGLHFNQAMLGDLQNLGVDSAFVTLHVGAGTFQPVRSEAIEEHRMHSEWFQLDESVCEKVGRARAAGGRVIAVGTTTVRCLESSIRQGSLQPTAGETAIFIYPGHEFQMVDALITNFHLPESTLLMLVSAFAGRENVLRAYRHAVDAGYRFFSYGDAMFISSNAEAR